VLRVSERHTRVEYQHDVALPRLGVAPGGRDEKPLADAAGLQPGLPQLLPVGMVLPGELDRNVGDTGLRAQPGGDFLGVLSLRRVVPEIGRPESVDQVDRPPPESDQGVGEKSIRVGVPDGDEIGGGGLESSGLRPGAQPGPYDPPATRGVSQ
jgi:hypothetical protein